MKQIAVEGAANREELTLYRKAPRFAPAGQSTQMIVGASPETDYHILKLTEGGLAVVSCTAEGPAACARQACCETRPMWDKLDKMIDDFFEGITLADLLKENME